MALSVLCLANLSACSYVPSNEFEAVETQDAATTNVETSTQAKDEVGKPENDPPGTSVVCANVPRLVTFQSGCHVGDDLYDLLKSINC